MNISTTVFTTQDALEEIFPQVLSLGTNILKRSSKLEKYNLSLREVFGLCILSILRNNLEPYKKWVFASDPQISDDGAVASIGVDNKIDYYECLEQVYLPGIHVRRDDSQSVNDYILEHVSKTKNKGLEYQKDKALLILSDVKSGNLDDTFDWQDFVKKFFAKYTFLHLYFLTLTKRVAGNNTYYLLSFTNQKHRQKLNGEFKFKVKNDGVYDFECIQEINLFK